MKSKTRNKYRAEIRRLKRMLVPVFPHSYGTEIRVEPEEYCSVTTLRKEIAGDFGSYLEYVKESALREMGIHIIKDLYDKGLIETQIVFGTYVDYLRIRVELYLKR